MPSSSLKSPVGTVGSSSGNHTVPLGVGMGMPASARLPSFGKYSQHWDYHLGLSSTRMRLLCVPTSFLNK